MARKLSVILSQTRSRNPLKRRLEEDVVAQLLLEPGLEVSVVPHLYDLYADHTGLTHLRSTSTDMVVLGWLYPRATFWTLYRHGIMGRERRSLLRSEGEEPDADETRKDDADTGKPSALSLAQVPNRDITCIDLRAYPDAKTYVTEIRRIASEAAVELVPLGLGTPNSAPSNGPFLASTLPDAGEESSSGSKRRWYPVIDYSKCTNCLECINFCLFGVYSIDVNNLINVDLQDNCRKGCPACSRICPEHAIIFPEHKTPAIAGAPGDAPGAIKIDLSKLFGAPDAAEMAALERDSELLKVGRVPVGKPTVTPKRQSGRPDAPKDDLDHLIDELDDLGL